MSYNEVTPDADSIQDALDENDAERFRWLAGVLALDKRVDPKEDHIRAIVELEPARMSLDRFRTWCDRRMGQYETGLAKQILTVNVSEDEMDAVVHGKAPTK